MVQLHTLPLFCFQMCFGLYVFCMLTFLLFLLPFPLLANPFDLFTLTKSPSFTVPTQKPYTPSQRVSELLNWPVSEAELKRALFPSAPDSPAQTVKKELKIIEFMRKKDPRSTVFSGTKR